MKCLVTIGLALVMAWGLALAAPLPAQACPLGPLATAGMDQALFEQALRASRNGEAEQALPLWDRFLAEHPTDAAALSNRGNVRLVLGDADGAIADQTRAMELSPDEIDPHLNRGTAEEALQQWDAAAADYRWILERDPQEASALYNLGNVRGSQDAWTDAADLYGQASMARPGLPWHAPVKLWRTISSITWRWRSGSCATSFAAIRCLPMPAQASVPCCGAKGSGGRLKVIGLLHRVSTLGMVKPTGCWKCVAGPLAPPLI